MIAEATRSREVLEVRTVDLRTGVTLPYVEQGDPQGTPVVLLHGFPDSWHYFKPLLPHLPGSLRIVAPTHRGFGEASKPASGYGFTDFSDDLVALLDALGIDSAVLVGHSMGGVVAQRFAIDNPRRTRGLVLMGSFISGRPGQVDQELWESTISRLTDPVDPAVARAFQESGFARPIPPHIFERFVRENLKAPAHVWRAAFRSMMEEDFSEELPRIDAPCLLVWGERDELVSRSEQDALQAAIADSRLVELPSVGHGVHVEAPVRVGQVLADFIARDKS